MVLYLIECIDVRWQRLHRLCSIARAGQVVKRRCQRGLLVDELVVEVPKSKK